MYANRNYLDLEVKYGKLRFEINERKPFEEHGDEKLILGCA